MSEPIPTPRTDAAEFDRDEDCSIPDDMIVTADFARQLERELAEKTTQFEALFNASKDAQKSIAGQLAAVDAELNNLTSAFVNLHTAWLGAGHRSDMNAEMDAMAHALGLDPLTLQPVKGDA